MKERVIDTALIAGLVLVAIVIVFTLFAPLPSRDRAAPSDAASTSQAASETGSQPDRQPDALPAPAQAPPEDAAPDSAAPAGQAAAPSPGAVGGVPEGALELERIGFSFAGPVGACNVPLEPWRHVAVSRDILAEHPCGSEVVVYLSEEVAGRSGLRATVGDTMGPDATRTVNLYVAPDEPAGSYGVQTGWLGP